jgi:hypothetical protein
MPMINGRFYSPFGHHSPYVAMLIQRYSMKAANDSAEASRNAFTSGFNNAVINQTQGLANIAAQRALDRINAETKAKAAATSTDSSNSDTVIPSPKNSVFSVTSSTTLDGGSQIDLNSNTLTLPDGTVVDLTTGTKKVDVVA